LKKIFSVMPLAFLLCFAFGCKNKEAAAELEKLKAQAAVEEEN